MARWHSFLLLSFTTLATTTFDVIREDGGDYFIWYGNDNITCEEFSNHTAHYNGSSLSGSRCECDKPKTFSTESSTCKYFTDQVYYRFDRSYLGGTSVSAVHTVCGGENICTLNSTVTNTERAVTKLNNVPLKSSSNCTVNFVEIIHDCLPRRVPLNLFFQSHSDHSLYLKLRHTHLSPISYLIGELFLLDITCTADGAYNKKMMFKHSGTRHLDEPGSFSNVPAYDPSKTCSYVTTTTSSLTAHTVSPTSTGKPNHPNTSEFTNIAIEVGPPLAVIVILTFVVVISYVVYRRYRNRPYDRIDHDVDQLNGNQNPAFGGEGQ